MSLATKIHLRPEEEIIDIIRRYPLTYFWRYLLGLAFMLISSFFMFWLWMQGWWGYALYGAGMLLGLYIIFSTWFFNQRNMFVVTNCRIVDIGRSGWFDEVVSSAGYLDVKDVFVRKKGILSSIFNYGLLAIETRSQQFVLEMDHVHKPQNWLNMILEAAENFRQNRRLSNKQAVYSSFIKIISDLGEAELCEIHDLVGRQLEAVDKGLGIEQDK